MFRTGLLNYQVLKDGVILTGGSGNNTLKQYICKGDTGEVVSNYKIYAPKTPGWYKIVYEYKDYLSKTYTFVI